jgi:hypothetical protein
LSGEWSGAMASGDISSPTFWVFMLQVLESARERETWTSSGRALWWWYGGNACHAGRDSCRWGWGPRQGIRARAVEKPSSALRAALRPVSQRPCVMLVCLPARVRLCAYVVCLCKTHISCPSASQWLPIHEPNQCLPIAHRTALSRHTGSFGCSRQLWHVPCLVTCVTCHVWSRACASCPVLSQAAVAGFLINLAYFALIKVLQHLQATFLHSCLVACHAPRRA